MNTTTKAQRTNKRQDAIWEKAKSLAADKSAPLGRCPKCKQPLRYYDGCLGYEAARCDACNFERDLHAEENGNPVEGEFAADKSAHTPGPWKVVEAAGEVTVFDNGAPGLIARCGKWFRADDQANARLIAAAPTMLQALKDLTAQIQLGKLNIRKDFSLINAHAAATKAIFQAEKGE